MDAWEKCKTAVSGIKTLFDGWKLVLMMLSFIGSLGFNGIQASINSEKTELIKGQEKAIKVYSNLAYQSTQKPEITKPRTNKVKRSEFANCEQLVNKHIKELHQ